MSLRLPQAPNSGLFKQGYQSFSNSDGAIIRNIEAVREISSMLVTSMGPSGRNKIIVNKLGKKFITNDAATICNELEIVHPVVKILIMASKQQEFEMGDFTNLVIILAGEFLNVAEKLLLLGLNVTEIIQGFSLANKYVMKILDELVVDKVESIMQKEHLLKVVKPVIAAKQYGYEDLISNLVVEAVQSVINPKNPASFNIDSIRVVKIMGSSLPQSQVVKGMVFPREPEGSVKHIKSKSKVVVFTCPIDISTTETKGTVLLHNAQEMLDFTKGEEQQLDQVVKEISASGVKVVVAGSNVGELALHYFNKYDILLLKVGSKFDLRRLCQVCGATPLPRLGAPMPDEMGEIDIIETKEIGGDRVTIFRQAESSVSRTATIVIRGATQNNLDDIERAIDDGVNSIKGLLKDDRLLPGAGAIEIELIKRITQYGETTPGLLQLAIKNFAKAFEVIPRVLIETSGFDSTEVLAKLHAAHSEEPGLNVGINIDDGELVDISTIGIYDLLSSKKSAIDLAVEATNTILSIDQIIMAKRAGGPVMPQQPRPGNWDQDD
ncbi:component of chaperonin-containing T-complex [Spathaspora passalidarum NRRL Y-27907]|uniref:Component of chaperonin-containing T-complex n=1 Tax=Spathaspora passalidarum (strain NRRL Y-27907 / 11-Y1) TaxID=619300 RepID=G3AGV0_SPAPN|nr:component of chaperonin-containing T-complex [Spathaspora passalidarum NRRL Y-27907]EGW34623.1 component of chaperonin-containing T-complex [Spathaspora passalidarum NRRL Y-27907]